MPPSLKVLKQRLESRGTDSAEKISLRLAKAEFEMSYATEFDITLINDRLEKALVEAEEIVRNFLDDKE